MVAHHPFHVQILQIRSTRIVGGKVLQSTSVWNHVRTLATFLCAFGKSDRQFPVVVRLFLSAFQKYASCLFLACTRLSSCLLILFIFLRFFFSGFGFSTGNSVGKYQCRLYAKVNPCHPGSLVGVSVRMGTLVFILRRLNTERCKVLVSLLAILPLRLSSR